MLVEAAQASQQVDTSLPRPSRMTDITRTSLDIRGTFNVPLTYSIFVICISQLNYGFETQGYAVIQSLNAFAKQFGEWSPELQTYYLPSAWLSMFNSFGLLGLAFGKMA